MLSMEYLVNAARVWVGALFLAANPSGELVEKPFTAVWNAPTMWCQTRHGIDIPVEDFGIITNRGGLWWGDKMVIFYEDVLGYYPELSWDETPLNGGIPQLADVDQHLTKVIQDIDAIIPDRNFDGYAVIDWEDWRPVYDQNTGVKSKYRRWSRHLVKQAHPDWEDDRVEVAARKQFEDAARRLMESTLEMAKDMRPKGKWGFYGFPRCYNDKGKTECSNNTKAYNDQLSWLYGASTALYPSAYIRTTTDNPLHWVYGHNIEALRVRKRHCRPQVPIMMYTRFKKQGREFYTRTELDASFQLTMDMGLDGVIIWGSSFGVNTKKKCHGLQKYVREEFGPYVEQKLRNAESCSVSLCNSNGRCVKRDPLSRATKTYNTYRPYTMFLNSAKTGDILNSPAARRVHDLPYRTWRRSVRLYRQMRQLFQDGYSCQCFTGWAGIQCDIPVMF